MGSVLGGSKSPSTSGITSAANNVATTAQAGGQASSQAITSASQNSANAINQGANVAGLYGIQGGMTAANAQTQAMQYLQQADQLPSGLREQALKSLGQNYGIQYNADGTTSSTGGSITDRAMASPLYQAAVQQGENSVLRNASATGGLRSGNASDNLAQVNQNALVSAYNDQLSGLQGLSSLPSNANTIAQYQAGIGNTLGQAQSNYGATIGQGQVTAAQTLSQGQIAASQAITDANNSAAIAQSQGQVAAAQSNAQASQNSSNNTMQLVGLGLTAASMFSDRRLKKSIRYTGDENGIRKYSWIWNKLAERLGLHGAGHGVMADEAEEINPDAVSIQSGYLIVNYQMLGVSHGV